MPSSSSSSTTIIKDGFLEMYKIILSFISRPESNAFRDPVDWKQLGLVDYPSIVKHPMVLGSLMEYDDDNDAVDSTAYFTVCVVYIICTVSSLFMFIHCMYIFNKR
jgi:hypothetical protein